MRISSRCEYGLRAMIYLARAERDDPVPLTEIARREDMPTAFLERILARLREGGLVASTRGASGGYRLSRPAEAISVADIVTAIEGPLSLVGCLPDEGGCSQGRKLRLATGVAPARRRDQRGAWRHQSRQPVCGGL